MLQVKDYMHKASAQIVRVAIENNIHEVIVGCNKGWKTDVQMGKSNKQTFLTIPFVLFFDLLAYKLNEQGIHFKIVEESYTSKASFIDNDSIPIYGDKDIPTFSGKRIERGLYRTKNGLLLNSDINGACNILRKHSDKEVILDYKLLTQIEKYTPTRATKNGKIKPMITKNSKKKQLRNKGNLECLNVLTFKTLCSPTNCVVG